MWQRLARDEDCAAYVDREMAVDVGRRDRRERTFRHDPSVVHENVQAAERSYRIRDRRYDVDFGRQVALKDRKRPVRIAFQVEPNDMSAGARQGFRGRAANAARSAGDERALAGEFDYHGTSPRSTPRVWPVMLAASSDAR
jgi:hypothetical protein